MLDWLSNQVKDYIKFTPLIRIFSNPGMKERHWKSISEYTGTIHPEMQITIKKVAEIEKIFENLSKLDEIS